MLKVKNKTDRLAGPMTSLTGWCRDRFIRDARKGAPDLVRLYSIVRWTVAPSTQATTFDKLLSLYNEAIQDSLLHERPRIIETDGLFIDIRPPEGYYFLLLSVPIAIDVVEDPRNDVRKTPEAEGAESQATLAETQRYFQNLMDGLGMGTWGGGTMHGPFREKFVRDAEGLEPQLVSRYRMRGWPGAPADIRKMTEALAKMYDRTAREAARTGEDAFHETGGIEVRVGCNHGDYIMSFRLPVALSFTEEDAEGDPSLPEDEKAEAREMVRQLTSYLPTMMKRLDEVVN